MLTVNRSIRLLENNIQGVGRSYRRKFHTLRQVQDYLYEHDVSVVCLQETFAAGLTNDEIEIPGYKVYRCDKSNHRGGVITYVKNSIESQKVAADKVLECLIIKITLNNREEHFIANFYRKPGRKYVNLAEIRLNKTQYFDGLYDFIRKNVNEQENLIITGDANTCTQYTAQSRKIIHKFTTLLGLEQMFNCPSTKQNSYIDNIWYLKGFYHLESSSIRHESFGRSPHFALEGTLTPQTFQCQLYSSNIELADETVVEPNVRAIESNCNGITKCVKIKDSSESFNYSVEHQPSMNAVSLLRPSDPKDSCKVSLDEDKRASDLKKAVTKHPPYTTSDDCTGKTIISLQEGSSSSTPVVSGYELHDSSSPSQLPKCATELRYSRDSTVHPTSDSITRNISSISKENSGCDKISRNNLEFNHPISDKTAAHSQRLSFHNSYNKSSLIQIPFQNNKQHTDQLPYLASVHKPSVNQSVASFTNNTRFYKYAEYKAMPKLTTTENYCKKEDQLHILRIEGEETETYCKKTGTRHTSTNESISVGIYSQVGEMEEKYFGLVKNFDRHISMAVAAGKVTRQDGKDTTCDKAYFVHLEEHVRYHSNILYGKVTLKQIEDGKVKHHSNSYSLSKPSKAAVISMMPVLAENVIQGLFATRVLRFQ